MAVEANTVLQTTPPGTGQALPATSVSAVGTSLLLVLALIFALVWAAKRMRPSGSAGSDIKIKSTLFLGPRERVILLDAAGKHVLLSVSPGQVRHLYTYDEVPKMSSQTPTEIGSDSESFKARLRTALGMGGNS